MPNWCVNKLYVAGPKKQVEDFLSKVSSEDTLFDFSGIIPYPEEWALMDRAHRQWEVDNRDIPWGERPPRPKDGYNQGGYEWCNSNWGTKWNAGSIDLKRTTRGCTISFDTPWSPPSPVIVKASELFPKLTFTLKYWECGMGFKGTLWAQEGQTQEDESSYSGHKGG